MALWGVAMSWRRAQGNLIGALEHESVAPDGESSRRRRLQGWHYPATAAGFIEPEAVAERVSDKTLLVSVMAAA